MATVWHLLGNPLGRAKVVRVFFLPRRGFFRFRVTVAKLVPLIFTPVTLLKNLAPHGTRKTVTVSQSSGDIPSRPRPSRAGDRRRRERYACSSWRSCRVGIDDRDRRRMLFHTHDGLVASQTIIDSSILHAADGAIVDVRQRRNFRRFLVDTQEQYVGLYLRRVTP